MFPHVPTITKFTDPKVNGILVQLPLPGHLDEQAIIERIAQHKVMLWHAVKFCIHDTAIKC